MPLYPSGDLFPSKDLFPSGQPVVPPVDTEPPTNVYPNPGFESGALAYDIRELRDSEIVDSTRVVSDQFDPSDPAFGPVIDGSWSLQVGASASPNTGEIVTVAQRVAAAAGESWSAAVQAAFATPAARPRLSIGFQDESGAYIGAPASVTGPEGVIAPAWLMLENQVAPPETVYVVLRLTFYAVAPGAGSVTFDNVVFMQSAQAPNHAIDGDRGGMEWLGARFYSPSRELQVAPVVSDFEKWTPPYLWAEKVEPPELV